MSSNEEKEGWVYCISNQNVRSADPPNNILLKIGMTDRTPQERLAEANRSDTWRPPVNFKIEFAKKVKNALKKEKTLHKLLEQYNERVNRSREFFDISLEKARLYFDLMDGEYWEPCDSDEPGREQPTTNKKKTGGAKVSPVLPQVAPRVAKRLKLPQVKVEGLTAKESHELIDSAIEYNALEIRVNDKYYRTTQLKECQDKNTFHTTMRFTATLISVDDADRTVSSANYHELVEKLVVTAPSTFILLKEVKPQNEVVIPSAPQNDDTVEQRITTAKVKELTTTESNTLLSTAFKQEALLIKVGRRIYRFFELDKVQKAKLKNSTFEASIVAAPDGIKSVDEDFALYVTKGNYGNVLKTLKNTSEPHVIILTEITK